MKERIRHASEELKAASTSVSQLSTKCEDTTAAVNKALKRLSRILPKNVQPKDWILFQSDTTAVLQYLVDLIQVMHTQTTSGDLDTSYNRPTSEVRNYLLIYGGKS